MSLANPTILGMSSSKPKNYGLVLVAVVLITVAVIVWSIRPKAMHVPYVNERMETTNNLKQIGLAFHQFDAKRGSLPLGAICDDAGKPLLSWRVAMLPYLDEHQLYEQFKLDEPWDSPSNKPLIEKMPAVFASPKKSGEAARGLTYYKVFYGEKAIFSHVPQPGFEPGEDDDRNRWSIQNLYGSPRGLANLVFAVEAGDPVTWTKPDDLHYAENEPLPNLASLFSHTIYMLMGDGRVIAVRPDHENFEAALRASIDPDGTSMLQIDQ